MAQRHRAGHRARRRGPAAIDHVLRAGDVGREVGAQEQHHIGHFLHRAVAPDRDSRLVALSDRGTDRPDSPSTCSEWIMRVSIGPGQTAFTRTPARATSPAATLVRPITACFDADVGRHARRTHQSRDRGRVHDRAPLSACSITGSTCRIPRNTPFTFTPITASNMSSSYSARGRDLALNSGIVVEAVDRAVFVQRGLDIVLHVSGSRHVGGERTAPDRPAGG